MTVRSASAIRIVIIQADIQASNGLVHIIDGVLIPQTVNVTDIDGSGLEVSFFPNPVQDYLNIKITDQAVRSMDVSLIDLAGRRVRNFQVANGGSITNISQLPAGVYTLELRINGETYSKQIMKQ